MHIVFTHTMDIFCFCVPDQPSKLSELGDWLAPLKKLPAQLDSETIPELVRHLKQYSDDVLDLPKGLVVCVRILHHLVIQPQHEHVEGQWQRATNKECVWEREFVLCCLCMCVYMYVCMYVYMYVCMHVCMYACMYVYMHVCMYLYMYVCMYV